MKVTCAKDELTHALSLVGRAVSTRATVQVLGGVLLRASEGRMQLSATDMELSLRLSVEAQVEGDGAVVAPGRLLVDLARLLPESEVVLEHRPEQGVLEVTCGPASYKLNTYSAEDFPKLPDVEGAQTFSVDSSAFLETVSRVARAASRDESRPVLTGVLVRFEGGKLIMAATDSYRMSVKETSSPAAPRPSSRRSSPRARSRSSRGSRRTPASCRSASRRTTSCSEPATCG